MATCMWCNWMLEEVKESKLMVFNIMEVIVKHDECDFGGVM